MKSIICVLFSIVSTLSPCALFSQEPTSKNSATPGQVEGYRRVLFTPAPGVTTKTEVYKDTEQRQLSLHIHFPAGWTKSDKRPVVIFFFGGGYKKGTPKQFIVQANHFAGRGLVTIRVDYRIKNKDGVDPDKSIADGRSAVRWVRAHAAELGVDPEKVISAGGSAGGHLAFCTAIEDSFDDPQDDKSISTIPQAMLLYNPALFSSADAPHSESQDEAKRTPENIKRIAPLDHVHKDTPPAMIFFGTRDPLMRGAEEYLRLAKKAGARAEMFTAEGNSHGFFNTEPWMSKTIDVADQFLVSLGYLDNQ